MVKINNNGSNITNNSKGGIDSYITTNLRGGTAPSIIDTNQANGALENIAQTERDLLGNARQARQDAAREQARLKEMKYQADSIISKLQVDVQQQAFRTIDILASIEEKNRQEKANAVANAYILDATSKTELGFNQFYNDARSKAGKYGEGLFDNTQEFVNQQLLDLEKNAPNEIAKAKLQQFAANFKVNALGKAIDDASNIRNNSIIMDADQAVNLAGNKLQTKPDADVFGAVNQAAEVLRTAGLSPDEVRKKTDKYTEFLVTAHINGAVNTGDFDLAKTSLLKYRDKFSGDNFVKIVESVKSSELENVKQQNKTIVENQSQKFYIKGQLTGTEPKEVLKAAGEVFIKTASALDLQLNQTKDLGSYVSGMTKFLENKSNIGLNEYKDYFQYSLSSKDPTKAVGAAKVIENLINNPQASKIQSTLGNELIARAEVINRMARVTGYEAAVKQADEILNLPNSEREFWNKQYREQTTDRSFKSVNMNAEQIIEELNMDNFFSTPDQNKSIELDYNAYLKDFYVLYKGNLDLAQKSALDSLKGQYAKTSYNANVKVIKDGSVEELGESVDRYPVDYFYPTEEAQGHFTDALKSALDSKYTIDWNERTINLNGKHVPFKVVPVPGVTETQVGKQWLSWQIVNATPGYEWDVIERVNTKSDLASEQTLKWYNNWVKNGKKWSEKVEKEYGSFFGTAAKGIAAITPGVE